MTDRFRWWITSVVAAGSCFSALGATSTPPNLSEYLYSKNDLGAVYSPRATSLKVWAPTATSVSILLYADATTDAFTSVPMRSQDGVWAATLPGNQDGKYYLYQIQFPPKTGDKPVVYRVNDPYARGCSANSGRTLIYDPRQTDPEGWAQDRFVPLKQNVDAVLYEVQVRDFSINRNSGISDDRRGRYLGMVQTGARTPAGERSGLDHLLDLGVTHVHLLPTFDFAHGDETQSPDHYTWYNWGYDPVLFNTPEGSFASNPNGTARQKEYKEMVQEFHRHHIGVIFDAVYNHTSATGASPMSIFDRVVPGYYYRVEPNGRYANGTYCGNEVASEKPMVRKFILDSVRYWMTEYHIDGFRFDLMGIEDRDTMLAVYREAKRINPNALIYGEGWSMEQLLPASRMMTQANVKGTGIAAFNDGIRDNIKGSAGHEREPGFVQGAVPPSGLADFRLNIKGQSTGGGIAVVSPNETINYDSCHDDNCLWDKLQISAPDAPEGLRMNMDKLAAGIVLTAQGVPFLHAGDEFLRSKNLVKNSFESNDPRVNPIDWSLKSKHKDVFEFYRGLIALRKAHPAFRLASKSAVDRSLTFLPNAPKQVVAYLLRNDQDSWKTIFVVYNSSRQPEQVSIPGRWLVVANERQAGTATLETLTDRIQVQPCSLVVAHSDGK